MHCNAVQLTGGDQDRLELAAGYAAELGLEVWFSPYPLELVTGVELSIMNQGFLPGDTAEERVGLLLSQPDRRGGDPHDDLDLASPGIVKVLEGRRGDTYPDMAWEPKAAFSAVAGCYGR